MLVPAAVCFSCFLQLLTLKVRISGWTSLSCYNRKHSTIVIWLCFVLQRKWYDTENEYYLLLFTVSVRCLFCTSFSLEYCWHGPAQKSSHSFLWMLAYVFYYPTFHNGPLMNFDEFSKQVTVFLRSHSYRFSVHLSLRWIVWWNIEKDGDFFSTAKHRHKRYLRNRLKHERLMLAYFLFLILTDINTNHEKMLGRWFHSVFLEMLF